MYILCYALPPPTLSINNQFLYIFSTKFDRFILDFSTFLNCCLIIFFTQSVMRSTVLKNMWRVNLWKIWENANIKRLIKYISDILCYANIKRHVWNDWRTKFNKFGINFVQPIIVKYRVLVVIVDLWVLSIFTA